jgi:hypothetical protein
VNQDAFARTIIKGSNMIMLHHLKSIAVSAGLLGAMLFCGPGAAAAQGLSRIVVDVPFEFIVNGKTLPAGKYSVSRVHEDSGYVLYIKKDGSNEGTSFTTNAAVNMSAPNKVALIFHHHGSDHYLAEVWTGSNNIGYRLPASRAELAAARTAPAGPASSPADSKGSSTGSSNKPADSKGSSTGQAGKGAPSKSS